MFDRGGITEHGLFLDVAGHVRRVGRGRDRGRGGAVGQHDVSVVDRQVRGIADT
jgi:hypothetical protein